jgi:nitroreductase
MRVTVEAGTEQLALNENADRERLLPAIRNRWSPRAFSDRRVSPEDLTTLLEAARSAASSANEQPWRFIVAPDSESPQHAKLVEILNDSNQVWAKYAPVLLLTAAKRTFTRTGGPNRHAMHDTGMALATLMIQATSMGIYVHAMEGFDVEAAKEAFSIPPDFEPATAVAIGYLRDPSMLSEQNRLKEVARSTRKPLDELVR